MGKYKEEKMRQEEDGQDEEEKQREDIEMKMNKRE